MIIKKLKQKRKKETKKKKNKKIETEIKNYNEDNKNKNNEEDQIVLQFKHDINQEVVYANEIHKIKPAVSDTWIKMISKY